MRGCPCCARLSAWLDAVHTRALHARTGSREAVSVAERCACGDWHWRGEGWKLVAAWKAVRP